MSMEGAYVAGHLNVVVDVEVQTGGTSCQSLKIITTSTNLKANLGVRITSVLAHLIIVG